MHTFLVLKLQYTKSVHISRVALENRKIMLTRFGEKCDFHANV